MAKNITITVVAGEMYLNYIPVYAWTFKRAYPEVDVKIIVWEDYVPANVIKALSVFGAEDIIIKRNFNCKKSNLNIKNMRWLGITYDDVKDYEYAHIGDVDFWMYSGTLFKDHIDRMKKHNMVYSNVRRLKKRIDNEYRLTGIHFYKQKPYHEAVKRKVGQYRQLLSKGNNSKCRRRAGKKRDEFMLYNLITESGLETLPVGTPLLPWSGVHIGAVRQGEKGHRDVIRDNKYHGYKIKEVIDGYETDEYRQINKHLHKKVQHQINLIMKSCQKLR